MEPHNIELATALIGLVIAIGTAGARIISAWRRRR